MRKYVIYCLSTPLVLSAPNTQENATLDRTRPGRMETCRSLAYSPLRRWAVQPGDGQRRTSGVTNIIVHLADLISPHNINLPENRGSIPLSAIMD